MNRIVLVAALLSAGCIPYSAIEASLRTTSSEQMGCPADQVTIKNYQGPRGISANSTWTAAGCGREWACRSWLENPGTALSSSREACTETESSNAETLRRVVIDRLALETGCPRDQVSFAQEADWSRGGEKAYRMLACGKAYVCTTAAGRTDCKVALAQ